MLHRKLVLAAGLVGLLLTGLLLVWFAHSDGDATLSKQSFEEWCDAIAASYARRIEYAEKSAQPGPPWVLEGFRRGLRNARERRISACPTPVLAALEKHDRGIWRLSLEYLERDRDTVGILIIERDVVSGECLIECYPLFAASERGEGRPELWRSMPALPVRIRDPQDDTQVKDVAKWHEWETQPSLETWPPAPLWISLPTENRSVELAIYDSTGHIGGPITVHRTD